jgi:hypothetical protein
MTSQLNMPRSSSTSDCDALTIARSAACPRLWCAGRGAVSAPESTRSAWIGLARLARRVKST